MRRLIGFIGLALAISVATAFLPYRSDELVAYGSEGQVEQNVQRREVAGWPAPFLADDPDTSVPHRIGPEDTFSVGLFAITVAFWFVTLCLLDKVTMSIRRRRHR